MATYTITRREWNEAHAKLDKKIPARDVACALEVPLSVKGMAVRLHLRFQKPLLKNVAWAFHWLRDEYEIATALGYTDEAVTAAYRRLHAKRSDLSALSEILAHYEELASDRPQTVVLA